MNDPYVKAIRWASDRIGGEGIVAFVTNSSFIDQGAFDSMRKCLGEDFTSVYVLDLGGNVRRNPKLSGTTHNVFGIQVGVSISLLVRHDTTEAVHNIWCARLDEWWRKEQKYNYLETNGAKSAVSWNLISPDANLNWLTAGMRSEFDSFLPLGDKGTRPHDEVHSIFNVFSNGVKTNRDAWIYNFSRGELEKNVEAMVATYNDNVLRWRHAALKPANLDSFVTADEKRIGWSGDLKSAVLAGQSATFSTNHVRTTLYRPFTKKHLYFDRLLNNSVYRLPMIVPTEQTEAENQLICLTGPGSEKPFLTLIATSLTDLHLSGAGCSTQCFPFYTYAEDSTNRRENITDWALEQFRSHYHDTSITKWDIFHYIYAVLHHPEYRERYAANLRRELPRIPLAPVSSVPPVVKEVAVFRELVKAGQRLAEIHVHYEQQPEYPLTKREKAGERLAWRVTRMRLSKDKTTLTYNDFLTLSEIPKETYDYRPGNRSALEWVIDQYQVSTDKRSGITNDPNRADDPQYILRLIGQVITVSLETVKIVRSLPPLGLAD